MDKFVEFISNNYVWFLTIALLLLFALIGYIYDNKKNKSSIPKDVANETETEELLVEENNKVEENITNIKLDNEDVSTLESTIVSEVNEENIEKIKEENKDEKPEMPAMKEESDIIDNN